MDAKNRFRGEWNIRRHILDLDSEWLGRFDGVGLFRDVDEGLHYHEEGQLQFGGLTATRAERNFIWTFPDPKKVAVLFDNGEHFHEFDPTAQRPRATHYADADEYDVTYDFSRWPQWRAEWRVEGPRKDYRLVSIYDRAD